MTPPRARVAWSIDGRTGHSDWMDPATAQAWVSWSNAAFGYDIHWVEWEEEEA